MRAALFPVRRGIRLDAKSGTQGTVKGVLRRIHHNPNMSWPGHQIAGLGVQDVAELLDSEVEARGTYIGIGEASALVEDVNEMGTIGLGAGAST